MRHDGGAAMDLGDQPQVDREGQLDLLSLAQSEILRLDEYTVCAQVLALQIRLFRPDITTYTVVRARCRVCKRRSIRSVP